MCGYKTHCSIILLCSNVIITGSCVIILDFNLYHILTSENTLVLDIFIDLKNSNEWIKKMNNMPNSLGNLHNNNYSCSFIYI